jgi:hypothetical protein
LNGDYFHRSVLVAPRRHEKFAASHHAALLVKRINQEMHALALQTSGYARLKIVSIKWPIFIAFTINLSR